MAAKLRVVHTVARDAGARVRELKKVQGDFLRRPHGDWHYRSFFHILHQNDVELQKAGVSRRSLAHPSTTSESFQRRAEVAICSALQDPYCPEHHLRCKLSRWKLNGIPAHVARRALKNFELLSAWCAPRVMATYLRTIFNGWNTDRRFASMSGKKSRCCLLGCGWDEDSIEHYATCQVYWEFLQADRPSGLAITWPRDRETFFGIRPGMPDRDRVVMAIGMYSLYRLVCSLRANSSGASGNYRRALCWWALRGADGSRALGLVRHEGVQLR